MSLQEIEEVGSERDGRGSLGLSHLIKEKDEERICFNSRRCYCRKRKCCVCLVYASLIIEVCILLVTAAIYTIIYLLLGQIEDSEERRFYRWSFVRIPLIWLPMYICIFVRLYYGFRWIFKGQTRRNFIAYYRLTMTSGGNLLLVILVIDMIILISPNSYEIKRSIVYNLVYVLFETTTLVFVQIYMKYLDAVNQVKNDVARTKQDFNY